MAILILVVLYVNSYLVLSRRGFAEAHRWHMKGFYFFTPRNSDVWRYSNYGCVYLYYPLIMEDNILGTGMSPACEPLWGLSK
jgi:hypothetical protein